MFARPTALQRDRLKLFLRVIAVSGGIGAVYGALLQTGGSIFVSTVMGVLNGVLIAGAIGGIEIFLLREGTSMKRLLRLPFVAVFLLKTAAYGAIVCVAIAGAPYLAYLLPGQVPPTPLEPRAALVTLGFSLATTMIFVIVLQAAGLLGRRTFRNLVLGRYRRPRAERRFFLFVDVVGSTAIAERLGPMEAHNFLAAVFSAAAEPVAASRGEIYQYVGDEIVVTWTESEGIPQARPLRCFFLMEESLNKSRENFREQFSVVPELRAALHLGEVIAGEVGEQRRAIVYHGDVMNTAARLEQATRDLGVRFIASAQAVAALGALPGLRMKDLGALTLRGRQEPIRAWGIERHREPAGLQERQR
jgi:adenylate cyclase